MTDKSERNVAIGDALLRVFLAIRRLRMTKAQASRSGMTSPIRGPAFVFRTIAQQCQVVNDNFSPILLLARFPVIPRAGLDLARDQECEPFLT